MAIFEEEVEMTFYKTIICLANSRKLGGRCIAGKELDGNKLGDWIRPVSAREHGELLLSDIRYKGGSSPRLLDITTIPLLNHAPQSYQKENYVIDDSKDWVKNGELKSSLLRRLLDNVKVLWVNGFHSYSGINDRIPQTQAEEELNTSLVLIEPQNISLIVQNELGRKKVRAYFKFNEENYLLAVTDFTAESVYRKKDYGEYPINDDNIYLCVSIGEPYNDFCYKLVAALINC
jgi:hypothetical protein